MSKRENVSDFLKISVYFGNHPPRHKKRRFLFSVATKIVDLINLEIFEFRKYSTKKQKRKINDEKQLKYVSVHDIF